MLNILSFISSTFSLPTVFILACICLFILVISTVSKSTKDIFPTKLLAIASAAKEPTPPTPNIIQLDLFNFYMPSFFTNISNRS